VIAKELQTSPGEILMTYTFKHHNRYVHWVIIMAQTLHPFDTFNSYGLPYQSSETGNHSNHNNNAKQ